MAPLVSRTLGECGAGRDQQQQEEGIRFAKAQCEEKEIQVHAPFGKLTIQKFAARTVAESIARTTLGRTETMGSVGVPVVGAQDEVFRASSEEGRKCHAETIQLGASFFTWINGINIIWDMNIVGIDLNLLIAFEALLDERHVGRAARRVGLSQPAFSNALSRLRSRLGDPLFVRTSHGMLPTPRAEQLGGSIRSALSLLRQTLEAPRTFDPAASARRFRVGLSDDVELRLVRLFAHSMRSGELLLQTRRLDGIFVIPETDLRSGALDLAVGYFPDARSLPRSFVMETVSQERNVVIARRGHPAFRKKLTLERLTQLDHAAVMYPSEPWGLIDNELASRGLRRRLRLALPHCLSVLHAVASSDLVACVQESVAHAFGPSLGLITYPEPIGIPPFVLRMAWHRQRSDDPAQRWLRELIKREIGSSERSSGDA